MYNNFRRMSISVPKELKKEMEEYKGTKDKPNWSALAAEAFRAWLMKKDLRDPTHMNRAGGDCCP